MIANLLSLSVLDDINFLINLIKSQNRLIPAKRTQFLRNITVPWRYKTSCFMIDFFYVFELANRLDKQQSSITTFTWVSWFVFCLWKIVQLENIIQHKEFYIN